MSDAPYTLRLTCHKHPWNVRQLTVYVGDEAPPTCPVCGGPMRQPAGIYNLVEDAVMSGYYSIEVRAERKRDGWTSIRHLPTFYLHENVQGIVDEDHACRIAVGMFTEVLDLGSDDETQVYARATRL